MSVRPVIHYSILGHVWCNVRNYTANWQQTTDPRKVTCERCAKTCNSVIMARARKRKKL